MKKIILILFFPLAFLAQTLNVQSPIRFLALGDSYTIGQSVSINERWPVQLRDSLALRGIMTDTIRIIATTGWRTDNLINAITNQQLQQQHYNLVSVLIGVNNQYQNTPLSQYLVEFPQLLDSAIRFAGGDTSHVFVVSIPDYAYTPYGQSTGNQVQITQQINQYNLINKHFTDSFNIKYFDITPISRFGLAQPNLVASDGLHPSATQYSQWVHSMLQYFDANIATTINENKNGLLQIYPNPSNGLITINIHDDLQSVEISNIAGQVLLKQKYIDEKHQLNLQSFAEGVYFVKIVFANGITINKKIVVNH